MRAEGLAVGHAGRPVVAGIDLDLPPGAELAVVGTTPYGPELYGLHGAVMPGDLGVPVTPAA